MITRFARIIIKFCEFDIKKHPSLLTWMFFWLREPDLNQQPLGLRCPTFARASVHCPRLCRPRPLSFLPASHTVGGRKQSRLFAQGLITLRVQIPRLRFPKQEKTQPPKRETVFFWLREPDLNQQPSGYEPDELPDCSIPRYIASLTGAKL